MSPFNPEKTARWRCRERSTRRPGSGRGPGRCQHRRPGPAPATWGPVGASHTPKPSVRLSPWAVPAIPREAAELGGCHQVRHPGPGLDGDFLCGGSRECVREDSTGASIQRTRGDREPGPRAPRSGNFLCSSWGHSGQPAGGGQPSPWLRGAGAPRRNAGAERRGIGTAGPGRGTSEGP